MTSSISSDQVEAGPSGTTGRGTLTQKSRKVRNGSVQTSTSQRSTPLLRKKSPFVENRDTASPRTPRTQPLSYYLETSAGSEMVHLRYLDDVPGVSNQNGASARPVAPTPSTSSIKASSSVPRAVVPPPFKTARRAALEAQAQTQDLPPADVFLNLYEAMRSSLSADFQRQYDGYQIIITGLQNKCEARLEDTEKQNVKLRERLMFVEKLRSEERGRWEVERKNLMRQSEQGENEVERREKERIQEKDALKEKEEQDKINQKLVEKYEAKKKLWAKERNELLKKVKELEDENKRLEDVITSDDQLLAKQLQDLEEENRELEEGFEEERKAWEVEKISLTQELLQAKEIVEKGNNQRGSLYSDTIIKRLNDVQQQNENLKKENEGLTTRCEWQRKKWDEEKLIMVNRLKQEIYEREAKRKRGDESEAMIWDHKKAKIEGHSVDEESEAAHEELETADEDLEEAHESEGADEELLEEDPENADEQDNEQNDSEANEEVDSGLVEPQQEENGSDEMSNVGSDEQEPEYDDNDDDPDT